MDNNMKPSRNHCWWSTYTALWACTLPTIALTFVSEDMWDDEDIGPDRDYKLWDDEDIGPVRDYKLWDDEDIGPVRAYRGDPHFITMDETSYDFNPIGEFIFLKSKKDEIQTRISQYTSSSGRQTQACYMSAFAIKSNQSDAIQVELDESQTFTIRVDGEVVTLEQGTLLHKNILVHLNKNDSLVVQTKTGINFEIVIMSRMLHLILTLSEDLKGTVSGLVGNWDDNPENDLMLPDGTWIPRNSSNKDIHYNFGMKWSTTNQTSLFTYPNGSRWEDFQNTSFVPDFSAPPPNPICGNDSACLYDAYVSGDKNVGLSNIKVQNRSQEFYSLNDKISSTCPTQVTILNGNVALTNETNPPGALHYTIQCQSGFQLVGSGSVTCKGGNYSTPFGACDRLTNNRAPPTVSSVLSFHLPLALMVMYYVSTKII